MILEGPVQQLRSQEEKQWDGGGEGQGAVCSRILMSTEGNILFFFSWGILLVHRSKSLSHKQGISHHALGLAG